MKIDIVADQTPLSLGLAPKNGVCVKILMRDLLVNLSKVDVIHFSLLIS